MKSSPEREFRRVAADVDSVAEDDAKIRKSCQLSSEHEKTDALFLQEFESSR